MKKGVKYMQTMQVMNIVYTVLWALLAVFCLYSAHKLSRILYIMGGFFVFMFGWYLANGLLEIDLFGGIYNVIFRCVGGAFLLLFILLYLYIKKHPPKE